MNRFQRAARSRRVRFAPVPIGFDDAAFEARAEIVRKQMAKIDMMPAEFRALVHEYGTKVRAMMRDGMTPDQIRRELA